MKLRWLIPVALVLPLRMHAVDGIAKARVETVTIDAGDVTLLHLRPEFESVIHMPEEVTSVILGSPGNFKAEHSSEEPNYVYVKPITRDPAQSDLFIATKSGEHVTLELISNDTANDGPTQPVDFLIEYRASHSFLISSDPTLIATTKAAETTSEGSPTFGGTAAGSRTLSSSGSAIDVEFDQQERLNAPQWTKWEGQRIETAIGDMRQSNNETVVSYSIFNSSDQPVEIVPPQIQLSGRKVEKKKKKEGNGIISDQLEIRDYRVSTTRLEPGGRADGVVVFDRPNFKQSTEKLFLQIAQADQIDRPILIRLPFTPPISTDHR